jgi:hypothetical protein
MPTAEAPPAAVSQPPSTDATVTRATFVEMPYAQNDQDPRARHLSLEAKARINGVIGYVTCKGSGGTPVKITLQGLTSFEGSVSINQAIGEERGDRVQSTIDGQLRLVPHITQRVSQEQASSQSVREVYERGAEQQYGVSIDTLVARQNAGEVHDADVAHMLQKQRGVLVTTEARETHWQAEPCKNVAEQAYAHVLLPGAGVYPVQHTVDAIPSSFSPPR